MKEILKTRTYVSGTDIYPYMPIVRLSCVRKPKGNRCERRGRGPRALRFVRFWDFMGSKVHKKWEIPYLGRRWNTVQNVTPLALSSAEKSVTVHTNKQTN